MNRLSPVETKQEFLQQLRIKIRNQEITEKELFVILLQERAKCFACGREITKQELERIKKGLNPAQRHLLNQWEKETSGFPPIQQVISLFDRVRIKY